MIRLRLAAQHERVAEDNPFPLEFAGDQRPLAHQVRTAAELRAGRQLVVNTHNTGTGKTRAALLHLHELARRGEDQRHALVIAPTNELIAQHVRDAEAFIRRNELPFRVHRLSAPALREAAGGTDVAEHLRHPTALMRSWLEQPDPTLVVTNPDIFYCALFFRYSRLHQRDVFRKMFARFWYIVVDEFHYYSPKQLICFLWFMALSKEWGYFGDGRQIALLTATPSEQVRTYLDRLGLDAAYVAPDGETVPPGPSAPALAPLDLHVVSADDRQGLLSLVEEQLDTIRGRVEGGEQGVGISSALWRVNQAYARLQQTVIGPRVARLTGPEPPAGRAAALDYDLVLATPTVDIGYNFERLGKPWQSVDFLLCDARSADELVQRLGRAGRVLGKARADLPSAAWATAPPEVLEALRRYDGTGLERPLFGNLIAGTMPPRFSEAAHVYLESGGIEEVFRPLFKLGGMMSREEEGQLRRVYERVRDVLAPRSRLTYEALRKRAQKFDRYDQLFTDFPSDDQLWGELPEAQMRKVNEAICWFRRESSSQSREDFCAWLERQRERYYASRARFAFRESFEPPAALIYDRGHDLSSADFVRYDILHVVQHDHATWFDSPSAWARALPPAAPAPEPLPEDSLFCVLTRMRPVDERVALRLRLQATGMTRAAWEARYCGLGSAIRGLELDADGVPLPAELIHAFRERYVPLFAARTDTPVAGKLKGLCHSEGWVGRELEVSFGDGSAQTYLAVMGTAMFLAAERLRPMIMAQLRRDAASDPAWII